VDFQAVQGWIELFSYPAVLLLLIAAGLGAPLSEDLILVAGGLVTAQTGGSLWAMIVLSYVGVITGDLLLFRIGRSLGSRALTKPWVRRALSPRRVEWVIRHFDRYGALTIVIARFCIGLRAVTFLSAGVSGMRPYKFFLADAGAALISVPLVTWAGYRFGRVVLADVEAASHWVLAAVAVALVGWTTVSIVRRWRSRRAPVPQAQAAQPEPKRRPA
jgi:membrane-associated protein